MLNRRTKALPRYAVAAALSACCASPASADWVFGGYRGDTATRSNTVQVTRSSGSNAANLTIGSVEYVGQGWDHPVYYGYRLSHFFKNAPHLGWELEFTHAKAIADVTQIVAINGVDAPLSQVLRRYELSHGLNFALANLAIRRPLGTAGVAHRLLLIGRAGGGLTFPHVETMFEGVTRNGYQYGGPCWQVGGGVEFQIFKGLNAIADLRLAGAHERVNVGPDGGPGPHLSGAFITGHFDVGLAYRIGHRP